LITFNGVNSFLEHPFGIRQFVASYISVSASIPPTGGRSTRSRTNVLQIPVFTLLILGYKIRKQGFNVLNWGPERSNDLRNTVQVSSETRKGRLRFPDKGTMRENVVVFLQWVWVWTK
jgi:amino acid transporter